MKIETVNRGEEFFDEYGYRDFFEIIIDGEKVFRVQDDEPEDSNLGRSFSDVYNIPNLIKMAYDAGKAGRPFEHIQSVREY